MSEATVFYGSFEQAAKKANKTATLLDDYSNEINKNVYTKLYQLSNRSGYLSNVLSPVSAKMEELNTKKEAYSAYAQDVKNALQDTKKTDENVRKLVYGCNRTFKISHGIRDSVIENSFSYLWTALGNSSPTARLISDGLETVAEAGSGLVSSIKQWWNYDGGRQLVAGVAVAALEIAAAVAAILSGGGFFAILAAAIALANGIMNLFNELRAYGVGSDDPALARRLSNQNTFQDVLREGDIVSGNGWADNNVNLARKIAMGIDITNIVCAAAGLIKGAGQLIKTLKNWKLTNGVLTNGIKGFGQKIKGMYQEGGIKLLFQNYGESFKLMLKDKYGLTGKEAMSNPAKLVKNWLGVAKDLAKNFEGKDGFGGYAKTALTNFVLPGLVLGKTYEVNHEKIEINGFSLSENEFSFFHLDLKIDTIELLKPDFITVDSFSDLIHSKFWEKIHEGVSHMVDNYTPTVQFTVPGELNTLHFQFSV